MCTLEITPFGSHRRHRHQKIVPARRHAASDCAPRRWAGRRIGKESAERDQERPEPSGLKTRTTRFEHSLAGGKVSNPELLCGGRGRLLLEKSGPSNQSLVTNFPTSNFSVLGVPAVEKRHHPLSRHRRGHGVRLHDLLGSDRSSIEPLVGVIVGFKRSSTK
jgi:hypothetical protein